MNQGVLKKFCTWAGSRQSYRSVSVVFVGFNVVFGAIAELGRTGNYVTSLLYASQFVVIWYFGYGSAPRGETK
jgi:hypothetical protein